MRRSAIWGPLAILAIVLIAWWVSAPVHPRATAESSDAISESRRAAGPTQNDAASPSPSPSGPAAAGVRAAASPPSRVQRAYRFVLNEGQIALEAAEELRGDFHPRRGEMAWQPGMFYFRLLDGASNVLAEQTMPAPDQQCVVLDPNTPDAKGVPQPAVLTASGPVVFQVRMPKVEGATQMRVYRLGGAHRAPKTEEPLGQLLASIPLVP